jgi:hypothetical protein
MAEVVVLRTSLPLGDLATRFAAAVLRGADVDLVVSGLRSRLVPRVVERIARGGSDALEAMVLAPLLPKELGLLLQARRMGRSLACRRVAGAREVVVEIRSSR